MFQTEGTAIAKALRQEASVAGVEGVRGEKRLEAKEGVGGTGADAVSCFPWEQCRGIHQTQRSQ